MKRENKSLHFLRWVLGLALLPMLAAILFIGIAYFQSISRYDENLFTPAYQDAYQAPYRASGGLEQALQTGDEDLYNTLTGLRQKRSVPEANPDIIYGVLLEVDEKEYFHYMFIDRHTYRRSMYYLQEVDGRWVVAPEDAYFYYHSGLWLKVFLPVTIIYLLTLFVIALVIGVFRVSREVREARGRV